jgi:endonuclease/exonuclease/phosphatase (EEP) superfamily protein YafD
VPNLIMWIPLGVWTVFVALHVLLSGRVWLWAIPELIPPFAFVVVPLVAGAIVLIPSGSSRPLAVVFVVALLAVGLRWSGLTVPRGTREDMGDDPLVVFVWNTQHWDQGLDAASFLRFLSTHDADVYLLQEYTYWEGGQEIPATGIAELAATMTEHEVFVDGELVTLVRRRLGPRARPGVSGTALRVDISVSGKTVALYNVHMPIQIDIRTSPFGAEFYRVLRYRTLRQWRAFRAVEDLLRHAPARHVIGGDFNSSPVMQLMSRLRARRVDVMRSAGQFYLATWPAGRRPLWRIDWILTSRLVTTAWARLVDPEGRSDHQGQLCALHP